MDRRLVVTAYRLERKVLARAQENGAVVPTGRPADVLVEVGRALTMARAGPVDSPGRPA